MTYTGQVKERKNGKPLRGVPVSDGRNIAFTDEEGRYVLTGWERAHVIHVGVLTNRHNDWFCCVSGERKIYDFCIDPVETTKDFNFLHISDTEIEGRPFTDQIFYLRGKVLENQPAFFIHTGDLCRDDGVPRHYLAMNCETMGCPVRYAIGNHDFRGEAYGEELYEKYYGPTWYSFDYGDIHFVTLEIRKGDKPSGYALTDQWLWLQNDLKHVGADKKIIIFDHDQCCWDETGFCPMVEDVTTNLRQAGLIAWIYGHYHFNFLHEYDGVLSICSSRPDSGGIDSSAAGVRKISVCGHTITSEMQYNTPDLPLADASVWCTQLEGRVEYTTPIEREGRLFVATMDDGYPKQCGVYCLDSMTGEIQWWFSTEDGIKNDVAVEEGKVYAQDTKGRIYCLNAETGDLVWQATSPLQQGSVTRSGVLIVDRLAITGSPACVYAYDRATGVLVWENHDTRYCENTPARFVYDPWRKQLIVSCHWKWLCAIDIDTGEMRWKRPEPPLWFRSATPLVTENTVYAAGLRSFARVEPVTGEYVKTNELGPRVDVGGAPVLDEDLVYYPTFTGGVIAVDKDTLEEKQRFLPGKAKLFSAPYVYWNGCAVESTPVIVGNTLIFSANDGKVYFFDKQSGMLQKSISVGAPMLVPPVIGKDYMITADFEGRITKFTL